MIVFSHITACKQRSAEVCKIFKGRPLFNALSKGCTIGKIKQILRNKQFNKTLHLNCTNRKIETRDAADIVAVAFNNDKVIEQQIRLIYKYLRDPFFYTIADNSIDPVKQLKIMELCKSKGIAYIRLPDRCHSRRNPSFSHGAALNWVYRNYILPRGAAYFGFIDHDIFPVQPTGIIRHLKECKVYGLIQERGNIWYLWPGFCFFDNDYINNTSLNFKPGRGLDTGGRNWKLLYSKLDKRKLLSPKHEYGKLREADDPQSDWYEKVGDWVHTFNASNWKKTEEKDSLVENLLRRY